MRAFVIQVKGPSFENVSGKYMVRDIHMTNEAYSVVVGTLGALKVHNYDVSKLTPNCLAELANTLRGLSPFLYEIYPNDYTIPNKIIIHSDVAEVNVNPYAGLVDTVQLDINKA